MFFETILTREAADRYRAAGWWPDRLLNDALAVAVAQNPGRAAVVDARGRMTYAALRTRVDRCALGLLTLGVRRGDVVTAQLPNWNEFVVLTLALERIGAVINPVAPIFRHHELRTMLHLAKSKVAVVPAVFRGWDYPAMYAELREGAPELRHVVVVNGDVTGADEGLLSWNQLIAKEAVQSVDRNALDWLRPSPDDVAELIFTSAQPASRKASCTRPTRSAPSSKR